MNLPPNAADDTPAQRDQRITETKWLIAYANQRLDYNQDPVGALSWWSDHTIIDGHTPLQLLANGELTYHLINEAIAIEEQSMT